MLVLEQSSAFLSSCIRCSCPSPLLSILTFVAPRRCHHRHFRVFFRWQPETAEQPPLSEKNLLYQKSLLGLKNILCQKSLVCQRKPRLSEEASFVDGHAVHWRRSLFRGISFQWCCYSQTDPQTTRVLTIIIVYFLRFWWFVICVLQSFSSEEFSMLASCGEFCKTIFVFG